MEEVKRRPIISARERGPGPARYALPPTVGYVHHDVTKPSSPAYSLHSRLSSTLVRVDSSPGPRYHVGERVTRFGRMDTPSFSMLGRGRRRPEDGHVTPGPGTYSPEKAPPTNAQRKPPSFTIGRRTCRRSVDDVPAPNSYHLPNLLGCTVPHKPSSASFSLGGRRTLGAPNHTVTAGPGPACYHSTHPDIYHQRQPSFSMQSRPRGASASAGIPGPGAYSPERSHAHLTRAPSVTMGVRHSQFITPLVLHVTE